VLVAAFESIGFVSVAPRLTALFARFDALERLPTGYLTGHSHAFRAEKRAVRPLPAPSDL
jgi:hypothetical protein